jgi:DNA invertase Pin-like site-specific DNA recombinase
MGHYLWKGNMIMEKSNAKIFGYVRVSTKEQNLDRQIDSLKKYVPDERDIFADKQSGKDLRRPAYQTLRQMVRQGDTIYVHEMARLGRNKEDILQELKFYKDKGIIVRILNLPTTLMDYSAYGDNKMQRVLVEMVNNILIEVLATMAEAEREDIRKRQREGITAAKKRGAKFGRPVKNFPDTWEEDYRRWKHGDITAVSLYRKYGMGRSTFYRKVDDWEKRTLKQPSQKQNS